MHTNSEASSQSPSKQEHLLFEPLRVVENLSHPVIRRLAMLELHAFTDPTFHPVRDGPMEFPRATEESRQWINFIERTGETMVLYEYRHYDSVVEAMKQSGIRIKGNRTLSRD